MRTCATARRFRPHLPRRLHHMLLHLTYFPALLAPPYTLHVLCLLVFRTIHWTAADSSRLSPSHLLVCDPVLLLILRASCSNKYGGRLRLPESHFPPFFINEAPADHLDPLAQPMSLCRLRACAPARRRVCQMLRWNPSFLSLTAIYLCIHQRTQGAGSGQNIISYPTAVSLRI